MQKMIFSNTNCRASYIYESKSVKTSSGKQQNDNKKMLPYVEKILNYFLTGKIILINLNSIKSQRHHVLAVFVLSSISHFFLYY